MKLILESWRSYTDGIEESMADLKAVKAKYKDDPILSRAVDVLEDRDPSGNHKYIAWMMKQIKKAYDENHLGDPDLIDPEPAYRLLARKAMRLGDAVYSFHDLSKKARAWKDSDGKPLSKDINSWESLDALAADIQSAKAEAMKAQREKEQKKQISMQAKEESDVVYDDEQFVVIRPLSAHASCYYGMGTKWCISATDSTNYFDSYTKEGKVFYIVIDKTRKPYDPSADDNDPLSKVAWVGDNRVGFDDFYDAENESMSYSQAKQQMEETTTTEKMRRIEGQMDDHLSNNPPDKGWDEKIAEIIEEVNNRMDHTTFYAEIGDEDSIYSHAATRFLVNGNFDTEEFKEKEDEIGDEVMNALRNSDHLYMSINTEGENVTYDWVNDGKTMRISVDISSYEGGINSPEELEDFASNIESEIDDNNEELTEEIRQEFIASKIIPRSFIDKVEEQIDEEKGVYLWDNLDVTYVREDLDYDIIIPGVHVAHMKNRQVVTRRVVDSINMTATYLQKQQMKQLNLPGIEATEEKLYTLPGDVWAGLQHWVSGKRAPGAEADAMLTIRSTNTAQTDADAKATYEVMKLVEQRPEIFISDIKSMIKGTRVDENKKRFTKIKIRG